MKKIALLLIFSLFAFAQLSAQNGLSIALLKYRGGGDWYANPTSLPNLVKFCNQNLNTTINEEIATVEPDNPEIFNYPFVHMTGHGNVVFNEREAENLRNYLISGGFLHIDDNYGLDPFIREQMKKVFPDQTFVELPSNHPLYAKPFLFPDGLPKIHIHDNKRAQGFGIFHEGRLVVFYTYECDLGDGWEDPRVHNDSEETRLKALRMGANLIQYVFGQ